MLLISIAFNKHLYAFLLFSVANTFLKILDKGSVKVPTPHKARSNH